MAGRRNHETMIRDLEKRADEEEKQVDRITETLDKHHVRQDQLEAEAFEQRQELLRHEHRLKWVEKHVEKLVGEPAPTSDKPNGAS
jgi:chromosome segregation ATPase